MSCPPGNASRQRRRYPSVPIEHNLLDPLDFYAQSPERRDILGEGTIPQNIGQSLIPSPVSREFLQLLPPPLALPAWPQTRNVDLLDNVQFEELELRREDVVSPGTQRAEVRAGWNNLQNQAAIAAVDLGAEGGSFLLDNSDRSCAEPVAPISEEGGSFLLENSGGAEECLPDEAAGGQPVSNPYAGDQQGAFVIALTERCEDPRVRLQQLQTMRQSLGECPLPRPPVLRVPQTSMICEESMEFPEQIYTPSPRTQAAAEEEERAAQRRYDEVMTNPRNYYESHNVQNDPYRNMRRQLFPPLPVNTAVDNLDQESMEYNSPTRGTEVTSPIIPTEVNQAIQCATRARIQTICAGAADQLSGRPNIRELAQLPPTNEQPSRPVDEDHMRAMATIRAHNIWHPRASTPDVSWIGGVFHELLQDSTISTPGSAQRSRSSNRQASSPAPPRPLATSFTYGQRSASATQGAAQLNKSLPARRYQVPMKKADMLQNVSENLIDISDPCPPSMPSARIDDATPDFFTLSHDSSASSGSSPVPIPPEFQNVMGPTVLPRLPEANRSMLDDANCEFYDNSLDISEAAGETHDTVEVQGPQRSPWRVQIRLMAPTSEAANAPQPARSGIPRGGAGAPRRIPGPSGTSRDAGPSRMPAPSGICRPAGASRPAAAATAARPSGLRPPSAVNVQIPVSGAPPRAIPCPPGQAGGSRAASSTRQAPPGPSRARSQSNLRPPSQTNLRPPSQTNLRPPSQTNMRQPSQTNMRQPSQTNMRQPSQTLRPPSQGAIRRPSQTSLRGANQPSQAPSNSRAQRPGQCPPGTRPAPARGIPQRPPSARR